MNPLPLHLLHVAVVELISMKPLPLQFWHFSDVDKIYTIDLHIEDLFEFHYSGAYTLLSISTTLIFPRSSTLTTGREDRSSQKFTFVAVSLNDDYKIALYCNQINPICGRIRC